MKRAVGAALAVAVLAVPAIDARADHDIVAGARTITGTVADALGQPVAACVYADRSAPTVFGVEAALDARTESDAAGAFELRVAPGDYHLFAYDIDVDAAGAAARCPHPGVAQGRTGRQFEVAGPIPTSSLAHAPVAITLLYVVGAGAPHVGLGRPDVVVPGEAVTVNLETGNRLRGRATGRWESAGLGVAVDPAYQHPAGPAYDRYAAGFTVPTVGEGRYAVRYWAQGPGGAVATRVRDDALHVDTSVPFYVSSSPPDGGSMPPFTGQTVVLNVGDAAGAGLQGAWIELYDITVTPENPFNAGSMQQCSADGNRWCQDVGLLPNRTYRATFVMTDWVGREAQQTIHFSTTA